MVLFGVHYAEETRGYLESSDKYPQSANLQWTTWYDLVFGISIDVDRSRVTDSWHPDNSLGTTVSRGGEGSLSLRGGEGRGEV